MSKKSCSIFVLYLLRWTRFLGNFVYVLKKGSRGSRLVPHYRACLEPLLVCRKGSRRGREHPSNVRPSEGKHFINCPCQHIEGLTHFVWFLGRNHQGVSVFVPNRYTINVRQGRSCRHELICKHVIIYTYISIYKERRTAASFKSLFFVSCFY